MKFSLARMLAMAAALLALTRCVVYDPYYPYGSPPPSGPSTFERSWNAATGAMRDQGVQIAREDRTSGSIEGQRGGISVKTRVFTQADGKVRVEFNAGGTLSEDPSLPDRISRSYEARMGR
jgi:hypothetical protein